MGRGVIPTEALLVVSHGRGVCWGSYKSREGVADWGCRTYSRVATVHVSAVLSLAKC